MKLVCEKYKKELATDEGFCHHPTEYCKFRTSCMVHFLDREEGRVGKNEKAPENEIEQDEIPGQGEIDAVVAV